MVRAVRVDDDKNLWLLALSLHYVGVLKASLWVMMISTFIFPLASMISRRLDSALAWEWGLYMLLVSFLLTGWAVLRPFGLQEAVMILPLELVPEPLKGYRLWLDEYYVVAEDSSLGCYLSLVHASAEGRTVSG